MAPSIVNRSGGRSSMAQYNIYLGNPTHMSYHWRETCFAVRDLFAPALAGNRTFDGVYVQSTIQAPSPGPAELLVYVLPNQFRSLTARVFGRHPTPNRGGNTVWWDDHPQRPYTVSEVYSAHTSPAFSAKLIYHEALHHRTHIDDRLHAGNGLAAFPVGESAVLTPENTRLRRRHINHARPQWLGGFATPPRP